MNDKIYVAKLGKAVGLKGHLRLFIDSDFPEQFKKGSEFITNKKTSLVIKEYNSNRELVQFENYEDVELAKKLTNQELYSTFEQTRQNCKLEENEHFWFDLMDCKIVENGLELGVVVEVHRYPSSDYLEIKTSDELVKKELPKTFLLPHLFDKYILNVDIKNKIINVQEAFVILENS
ncbi:ribosome maturation factor RimM [Arcobacter roscoffensis]|uniref:Ribosome maturation factor RimM n=1 Tax=Arcobacter roscoffensis TaxID=2961520 RepID=A0ABY5E498_9BACT|nr:ribosome maturation factor RimM [Arcobacter roscoffensis]UTJ05995.1 ribosome maturation factor RimM [Arcobacter roscoffensis]